MKTTLKIQLQIAVLFLVEILFILYANSLIERNALYVIIAFFVLNLAVLIWVFIALNVFKPKNTLSSLDTSDLTNILDFGEFSFLEYDENLNIINTSGLLKSRHSDLLNKKINELHPNFNDFIIAKSGKLSVNIDAHSYEVENLKQQRMLIFKNIEQLVYLQKFKDENTLVLGLLNLDNLNNEISYMEERQVSEISATIRKLVNDWAYNHKILLRRLRNDRYFLVAKLSALEDIKKNINNFLKNFKQNAHELGSNITSSIVFAYGSESITTLDTKINELLELALARGGDQMIVHNLEDTVEYFGGNSETQYVKSNVRSRVMAQSLIDLIEESNRIFVFGHKTMDFDSMGSCIAISRLCQNLKKEVYIVSESGGIEEKLSKVLEKNVFELKDHEFISDTQAVLLSQPEDLVILVDHHKPEHSAASELVHNATNIVVIDHHRRGSDFVSNPILTFLDSSASSVCEMMIDIFKVSKLKIELSTIDAEIMYTGILVDTNHFTARTNTRTFEACAYLKEFGIDLTRIQESLNESIEDFNMKTRIRSCAYQYENMMIAAFKEEVEISRTVLSQVADHLLSINGIDASFVIGYTKSNQVGISARSNKNINVQMIMEKMNGGGHFNAAAMQRDETTVEEIENELITILENREE